MPLKSKPKTVFSALLLIMAVAAIFAINNCGGGDTPSATADSGSLADGGPHDGGIRDGGIPDGGINDGGTTEDGGPDGGDAGIPEHNDGGIYDGGNASDGGPRPDGGISHDGGFAADAGTMTADGGAMVANDGGALADGGTTLVDGGFIDRMNACFQCQNEHCQAEKDACASVDADAGTSTGPCAEVVTCLLGCSDEVCWALCAVRSGPSCAVCANELRNCEQAACGDICQAVLQADGGSVPDAGVLDGGDPCAVLAACCPNLPSLAQTACENTASAGNPQICAASLVAAGSACQ